MLCIAPLLAPKGVKVAFVAFLRVNVLSTRRIRYPGYRLKTS